MTHLLTSLVRSLGEIEGNIWLEMYSIKLYADVHQSERQRGGVIEQDHSKMIGISEVKAALKKPNGKNVNCENIFYLRHYL